LDKEVTRGLKTREVAVKELEAERRTAQDKLEWGHIDDKTGKLIPGLRERMARIGAAARAYQTDAFSTVAVLESGEPVVQNRADGRMQVQGDDGKMRPLTGPELKKVGLTQKTSGEKAPSNDAEWDAELKRFAAGHSTREEFVAAGIARDAKSTKNPLFPPRGGNAAGGRGVENESRPLTNAQPARSDSEQSNWGALSSWSAVAEGMRRGDEGAWKYAERRVGGGPGSMGVNPPADVLRMLDERKRAGDM
jgi:hypothetical protein